MFLPINLFVGLLVGFPVAMVVRELIADLMAGLLIMNPHLDLSGLRIKYLLAPVRPSWARNVFSSGCTTLLALK